MRPDWILPEIGDMTEFPVERIAKQLGALCRYAGATPDHYSVARHSLLVSTLVPDKPDVKLAALLHDAHEAFTGDILRPLTAMLCRFSRQEIVDRQRAIDRALYALIGFDPCPVALKIVADADDLSCKLEMQLLGKSASEITDAIPTWRDAAWQLSFHGNARIDAQHWLDEFHKLANVVG